MAAERDGALEEREERERNERSRRRPERILSKLAA
jgi:hypothetical protein